MLVQVIGGVCESGEDQHLTIAGIDWRFDFCQNQFLQVLELRIISRRYLFHFTEKRLDQTEIRFQVVLPRGEVHVAELDIDLAAGLLIGRHLLGIKEFKIFVGTGVLECCGNIGEGAVLSGFAEVLDAA